MPEGIDTRGPLLRADDSLMDIGLGEDGLIGRQQADLMHLSVPTQVHYEDRMSMACSREVRLPFLDYRMVELLLPLEPELKLRDGWAKWIFRKAVEDMLPPKITWRKDKMGFANPQSEWLRNEFREEVEGMLHGPLLIDQCGLVNRAALKKAYEAYCSQKTGRGSIRFEDILHPLALEIWMRKFESSLSISEGFGSGLPMPMSRESSSGRLVGEEPSVVSRSLLRGATPPG